MLVLKRSQGETVLLKHQKTGEAICVKVVELSGGKLRLGFTATRDWEITRPDHTPRGGNR